MSGEHQQQQPEEAVNSVTVSIKVVEDRVMVTLKTGGEEAKKKKAEPSADREAEAAQVRERLASEAFGKREDVQELMQSLMQATISARPSDPLPYMIRFLEKQVQRRELGWGK